LVAALVLAFGAQYYLSQKRDFMWDGVALYICAMVLFGIAAGQMERRAHGARPAGPGFWEQIWDVLYRSPLRAATLLAGAAAVAVASSTANTRASSTPYYDLIALWAAGVALAAAAMVDWKGLPERAQARWQGLRRAGPEVAFVAVLILATVLLRAIALQTVPYIISGDEANMGLEALDVLDGRRVNPFATGWLSHPTLYFFMQAAFLKVLGISTAALRLPSALISGAIALLLYLYTKRTLGRRVAALSLIYFACYEYAIHFGRIALNNIWDPFFALGGMYCLQVGLEDRKRGYLLLGGAITGLGVYGYMGARLVPLVLAAYLVYCLVTEPGWLRKNLVNVLIFGLMALLVAAPLFVFWRAHPQDMMARWQWVGIFPSGWVAEEVQRTGTNILTVVLGQFTKAALAFNYTYDRTFHYRPETPLILYLMSVFFVLGLAYAIRRIKERSYFVLVIWLLAVVIFGGTLVENPPSSPRLILSLPVIVMLVALGIAKVSDFVQRALGAHRSLALALSLALVLVGSYQSLHFYYGKYIPEHMYSDWNTEISSSMGKYVHMLGPDYVCYYYGPLRIYFGHGTNLWEARGIRGVDVPEGGVQSFEFVDPTKNAVFVFLPERMGEFGLLRAHFPEGLLREFKNPKGQLMFSSYEVLHQ
jgi:hypothetical protein